MTKWNQQTVYSQLRSLEGQEVKPSKRRNSSVSRAHRLEAALSQSQPQPTTENHLRLMAATLDLAAILSVRRLSLLTNSIQKLQNLHKYQTMIRNKTTHSGKNLKRKKKLKLRLKQRNLVNKNPFPSVLPSTQNSRLLVKWLKRVKASHNFTVDEYKTILRDAAMDLRSLFNS